MPIRGTCSAMSEPVNVVPYDPGWPSLFALERSRVEAILGSRVQAKEHVGSAAIPGLDAKPAIDLMVEVRDVQGADHYIRPLEGIGYLTARRTRISTESSSSGSLTQIGPRVPTRCTSWRCVEISGMICSSVVTTSAPTLRRLGNTRNSNTTLPAASETTVKRTPRPRQVSSPRW